MARTWLLSGGAAYALCEQVRRTIPEGPDPRNLVRPLFRDGERTVARQDRSEDQGQCVPHTAGFRHSPGYKRRLSGNQIMALERSEGWRVGQRPFAV